MTVTAWRTITEHTSGKIRKPDGTWWETYYEGDGQRPENRRERQVPPPRTLPYPSDEIPGGEIRFHVTVDAPVEVGTLTPTEGEVLIRALRNFTMLTHPGLSSWNGQVQPEFLTALGILARLGVPASAVAS